MEHMPERISRTSSKRWFKADEYLELLRSNGTKDGISMLAILYALQFYK